MSGLCNQYDVLPLATRHSGGLNSPAVLKLAVLKVAVLHQDWLDRESHPWKHLNFTCQWSPVVMNQRGHVKVMCNSMATKLFIHEVAVTLCVVAYQLANLTELKTWLTRFNCRVHCLSSYLAQFVDFWMHFDLVSLQHHHSRVVAVVPLLETHYVNIKVVSRL
jgi:hypothetical protein